MGVHPIHQFIFWSSMMGFFWVIWCTYNNPWVKIQHSMGQNHHYPWVRVLEQHAALYTILYTILIGWGHICQKGHTKEAKSQGVV